MRATPSAVHFARRGSRHVDARRSRARALTHGDPSAQWGAALYHAMLHAAIHGDDPFAVLAELLQSVTDLDRRFAETLDPGWDPRMPHVRERLGLGMPRRSRMGGPHDQLLLRRARRGDRARRRHRHGRRRRRRPRRRAIHGIQAVPSRWTTYLHGYVPDARRADPHTPTCSASRYELLGQRRGPGAAARDADPTDRDRARSSSPRTSPAPRRPTASWAVVSLCRVGQTFAEHPTRRELYLIDQEGDHNAHLGSRGHRRASTRSTRSSTRAARSSSTATAARAAPVSSCGPGSCAPTAGTSRPRPTGSRRRWPALDLWNRTFTEFLRSEWIRPGRRPMTRQCRYCGESRFGTELCCPACGHPYPDADDRRDRRTDSDED